MAKNSFTAEVTFNNKSQAKLSVPIRLFHYENLWILFSVIISLMDRSASLLSLSYL